MILVCPTAEHYEAAARAAANWKDGFSSVYTRFCDTGET